MEIESYEEYLIGNKLHPSINLNYLAENLTNKLRENKYEVQETGIISGVISGVISGTISGTISVNPLNIVQMLGAKNNIRVELNRMAQALNIIGQSPAEVTQIFMDVTNILKSIGFETSLFYEIVSTIITTDGSPIEILNKSVTINPDVLNINNIKNNIIGIRIGGENELENKQFTLSIEPNFASPSNRFFIRLQYRTKDINEIELFHKNLNEKIKSLI